MLERPFSAVSSVVLAMCIPLAISQLACTNETILRSGKDSPTPAPAGTTTDRPTSGLDQDIEAMRTADFRFIWVLRRKDGGVLDAADKAVIKANTADVNRRVLTDDNKALVIGTNAIPDKARTEAIFSYFSVEDLSPFPMPSVIPTAEKTPKPPKKP